MSNNHYLTKSEDQISFSSKLAYSSGVVVNNLLGNAVGTMMVVLNLAMGMNPALVGLLGALPRLTDAFTDPMMGFISDKTKSKWGRRRPYIFFGAILTGVVYSFLWQLPRGGSENLVFWYFLIGSIIFYLGYTIFATPLVALGYELTPDYHERTRLMGFTSIVGSMVYLVTPWLYPFMENKNYFKNPMDGAATLGIIIGVVTIILGVIPAICLKERYVKVADQELAEAQEQDKGFFESMREFFKGFAATLKFKPFLCLCGSTFLVFNSFMLVSSFQLYILIYYMFGGDKEKGAIEMGIVGTIQSVCFYIVSPRLVKFN